MKITKSQLKQIIKEELSTVLKERDEHPSISNILGPRGHTKIVDYFLHSGKYETADEADDYVDELRKTRPPTWMRDLYIHATKWLKDWNRRTSTAAGP